MIETRKSVETPDFLVEARALLAVGMDGSVVVLQVNPENQYLAHDASADADWLAEVIRFWPEGQPSGPGLYEFRGFSSPEPSGPAGVRVIHRGHCHKVAC